MWRQCTGPRRCAAALTLLLLAAPAGCKQESNRSGGPADKVPAPAAVKAASPTPVSYKPLEILETKTLAPFPAGFVGAVFAPDLSKVMLIVREAGKMSIYVNKQRIASGLDSVPKATISRDSSTMVYMARVKGQWQVSWGDKKSRVHRRVKANSLGFVKGGGRFSYRAVNARGKHEAVVDGRTISEHDEVGPIGYNPGGKHFGYVGTDRGKGTQSLYYDGKAVASGKKIVLLGLSQIDGKFAYSAFDGKTWTVTINGAKHPKAFDEVAGFAYSPDGKRTAFLARKAKRWLNVLDGVESEPYDDAYAPVFSPDSKRVGFAAKSGGAWRMIVDGEQGPAHRNIGFYNPVFSPDSKHVAYWAVEDKGMVVVRDGVRGKHHDVVSELPLTFSDRGNHLGFVTGTARTDAIRTGVRRRIAAGQPAGSKHIFRWRVVVDGKALPLQAEIGRLYLSPNGERVVYVAGGGNQWAYYTEGRRSPLYWSTNFRGGGGVTFLDERRIKYSAIDPRQGFLVVTARLP